MTSVRIRDACESDRAEIARVLTERWTSTRIVSRGRIHQADRLPAIVAEISGDLVGVATYRIDGDQCEVVSLDSLRENVGVGGALLAAVVDRAREAGCRRVWLITTNDNRTAIRFYENRGWKLAAVHRDAMELSRRLKPSIPLVGENGVPIRDEIEFELLL